MKTEPGQIEMNKYHIPYIESHRGTQKDNKKNALSAITFKYLFF